MFMNKIQFIIDYFLEKMASATSSDDLSEMLERKI